MNFLRIFFLFITICAIGTAATWAFNPKLINRIDDEIINKYEKHYTDKFNAAGAKLSTDRSAAFNDFESLLEEVDYVQKGDRLDAFKRKLLNVIIQEKIVDRNFEGVEELFTKLIEHDDKDLTAQMSYADYLFNFGDRNKAIAKVESLYTLAPSSFTESIYISSLAYQGKILEAFNLFYNSHSKSNEYQGQKWQFFWDDGEGYIGTNATYSALESLGNYRYRLQCDLPKRVEKIRGIRFDPPSGVNYRMSDWRIEIKAAGQVLSYNSYNIPFACNRVDFSNKKVLVTKASNDPYCYFDLPAEMSTLENIDINFEANIHENFPVAMERMFMNRQSLNFFVQQLQNNNLDDQYQFFMKMLQVY